METQEDVFNGLVDAFGRHLANSLYEGGAREPELEANRKVDQYRRRFAAACKVPVPKAFCDDIKAYKRFGWTLADAFYNAKADYDEYESTDPTFVWIVEHPDTFARAWLNGWIEEEDED